MKQKIKLSRSDKRILFICVYLVLIIGFGVFGLMNHFKSEHLAVQKAAEEAEQKQSEQKQEIKNKNSQEAKIAEIDRRLKNNDTKGLKVVFLTFDDGPSIHSEEVLDILKQYDVKATFFSIGGDRELANTVWNRIIKEGHTLANHTLSHNYDLYNDPESFYADVQEQSDYQKEITGQEPSGLFRFPGGSLTANETCCRGIVERGYNYVDWNVSTGDAASETPEPDTIIANVVNGCAKHDVSIVLCHGEVKENTRTALPDIIKTLKEKGYTFMPMKKEYTYHRQIEI